MNRTDLFKTGMLLICTVCVTNCCCSTQQKLSAQYPPKEKFPITNDLDMAFVKIPKGSFMMGSPDKDKQKTDGPQHLVTITEPFYIGVYEVTQRQWNKVMGRISWSTHSHFAGRPDSPIEDISWQQVQEFLAKINARGDGVFRLPTEAEWEYACRAGTTTRCHWGDDLNQTLVDEYAWRSGGPDGTTHPVGQKLPNPWGLYDMCGNVVEFCQDKYGPYRPDHQFDPLQQDQEEIYVAARGGDWYHGGGVDSETRRKYYADGGLSFLGFRVIREVD